MDRSFAAGEFLIFIILMADTTATIAHIAIMAAQTNSNLRWRSCDSGSSGSKN